MCCLNLSQKRKLKKLLIQGFNNLDFDEIILAIVGLIDYDTNHNTRKLDKYLNKVILEFKNDENKLNINRHKLSEAIDDFDKLPNIFDMTDEEEEEINDVLDEKMNEVMKRRKEVLIRRNQLQADRLGVIKKKQRRHIGGMG